MKKDSSSFLIFPKVSIVVPVYNGSNYLFFALNSLKEQTYKNIEIIIVDDGSDDGGKTRKVAEQFLLDERFRYFRKENGGVASALNLGIEKSTGDYLCWLSHDDCFPSNKIEKQIKALKKLQSNGHNGDKIIIYTKCTLINDLGKKWSFFRQLLYFTPLKKYKKPSDFFGIKHVFYGSLLLPRKALVNNRFIKELKYSQDTFSFFQLLSDGYVLFPSRDTFTYYRVHKEQGSFTRTKDYDNDVFVMDELLLDYFSKTNDLVFLKKYFFDLSKKYYLSKSIQIVFVKLIHEYKGRGLSTLTILFGKTLKFIFHVLYFFKKKAFGR